MKKRNIKKMISMMLAAVLLLQGPILSTESGEHTYVHAEGNSQDSVEQIPECNENPEGVHVWNSTTGLCEFCNKPCEHQWNSSGYCSVCTKTCTHAWDGYGTCLTCSYSCSHEWSNGICTICQMNHSCEKYDDGKCMVCGKPCQHTEYKDSGVDGTPTCTEKGTHYFHCKACGQQKTEEVPALGHDWRNGNGICAREDCGARCEHAATVIDAAVAATCCTTGLTEGSHCKDCGMVLAAQNVVPIDPNNHTGIVELKGIAATCTATGWTDGSTCEDCHAVIKAQEEIAVLSHTAVIDAEVAATCTTAGLTEGSHCSVCQAVLKEQEEIPALDHKDVVEDEAIAATCKKDGKTAGSHCGICGEVLTEQKTVKATGHNWKWKSQKQPSCTENGEKIYGCTNCSAVRKEVLPATGHSFTQVKNGGRLETDENGNWIVTYDYICSGCGMKKQQHESMSLISLAGNKNVQVQLTSGLKKIAENSQEYHLYEITDETGTHYYLENSGSGEGLDSFSFESSNGNLQSVDYGSGEPSDGSITLQSGGEGASELGFHTESSSENGMSFSFSQDNEKQEVESIEVEKDQVVILMENGASMKIPTKNMKASVGEIEKGAKTIEVEITDRHAEETDDFEMININTDPVGGYPSETAVESETETEAATETLSEAEMETEVAAETEFVTETEVAAETEAATETVSEVETETESAAERETESETETETEIPTYVEIVFSTKIIYEETEAIKQIQETEERRIELFVDETETETEEPPTIIRFQETQQAQNYIEVIGETKETNASKKETSGTCVYSAESWPQPLCKCVKIDGAYHECQKHGTIIEHVKEFRAESFYKWSRYCPVCDTWNL